MFTGVFVARIDATRRTTVPALFREVLLKTQMNNGLVITNSLPVDCNGKIHQGLMIYPIKEWQQFKDRFEVANLTNNLKKSILNVILAPARECSMDDRGRIQIPKSICNNGLNGLQEVVLFGKGSSIELWNTDSWAEVECAYSDQYLNRP